jgi:hypothetical protein
MAASERKLRMGSGGGVSVSNSPAGGLGTAESSPRSVSEEATDDVLVPARGAVVGTGRGRLDVTGEELGCGFGFPYSKLM